MVLSLTAKSLPLAFLTWSIRSAAAVGVFDNPSGADGANTFEVGSQINVRWHGAENYAILSLGYYSLTNRTTTWLISAFSHVYSSMPFFILHGPLVRMSLGRAHAQLPKTNKLTPASRRFPEQTTIQYA